MVSDPGIVPLPNLKLDFSDLRNASHRSNRGDSDTDSDTPRQSQSCLPDGNGYVGENWTVCGRCEAYRPPRSHHCRICKRCVRKMDHHCPWINNCVGEFNQKYFLQFLIYVGIASAYCIGMVIAGWVLPCETCKREAFRQSRVLHSIFVTIECVLFCLFVFAVSCDQFQAIFNDETAIEHVQRRGSYRNEYSKMRLLREVCGRGHPFIWLLPCHSIKSTTDYVQVPRLRIV